MKKRVLTIATRKSELALWQAKHVRERLLIHWPDLTVDLLPMSTSGDKFNKTKLLDLGGKGLFIKELEEALLDKRADLAVHSMKDVTADFPKGLELPVICERGNPFDALLSHGGVDLDSLPHGAVIGTSSLRRQSQLLAYRPDLNIKFLRGNIHTRQQKLKDGEYDGIILAAAGLERMGMQKNISQLLTEDMMLPACGQGALGIECREDDMELKRLLDPLRHPHSSICVNAERLVNARLGGNCHVPLAVFCTLMDDNRQLLIRAKVCSEDGKTMIEAREQTTIDHADEAANRCALSLLDKGADKLLAASIP